MPLSKLDRLYRAILLSKYFVKGWGDPHGLKRLFEFRKVVSNRESCYNLVDKNYPVHIDKDEEWSDCRVMEGHFKSPFVHYLPGLLPEESENAHFQVILPKKWTSNYYKPICLHMAGTGDHYYWRRRQVIAKPLLKEANISSILLENPFYGLRKPKDQVRSILHNVSDIFVMGGCLILESLVLFHWCQRQGFGPLGVTGMSMGGHMASLAATNWPHPIVLVPCLSWSTASGVFTEGVISGAINWKLLETQFQSDKIYKATLQKMVSIIEDDAFRAGQQFAKTFERSIAKVEDKNEENKQINGANLSKETREIFMDKLHSEKRPSSVTELSMPNLSRLRLTNSDDRTAMMLSLKESNTSARTSDEKINWKEHEALHFMRGIMDECTHLRNFSIPVDTSLIVSVCARDDGYVPREGVTDLTDIWPGAEVRYINAGHITAFVLHQKVFRSAIIDAFNRARSKYMFYS
ncbi:protein ABHD18 isoform X2 [Macrosteles quadrilineatus]|uniref:protein ABHD18 isoform X2 n=1 Tax=Macrosteles quadrilineatus TaxID=74068 RepID=UPI0023E1561D|nr:protein ABHD18 isoform X2 [Macrosteles quadrilineatus]